MVIRGYATARATPSHQPRKVGPGKKEANAMSSRQGNRSEPLRRATVLRRLETSPKATTLEWLDGVATTTTTQVLLARGPRTTRPVSR
jgi:hypothetical protein